MVQNILSYLSPQRFACQRCGNLLCSNTAGLELPTSKQSQYLYVPHYVAWVKPFLNPLFVELGLHYCFRAFLSISIDMQLSYMSQK